jgi:hypothetical protein
MKKWEMSKNLRVKNPPYDHEINGGPHESYATHHLSWTFASSASRNTICWC